MRPGAISLAAALAITFAAAALPAATIGCRDWLRLGDDQKMATIDGMVADLLGSSGKVRQYDVHRGALGRCINENAVQMSYEFDDVCSDSRTADMQAIQRVFKSYVWSCS